MTGMRRTGRRVRLGLAVGIPLLLLAAAAAVARRAMQGLADVPLGFHGTLALVLGIAGIAIVGGGLMFLVFHSARTGHDEAASLREGGREGS